MGNFTEAIGEGNLTTAVHEIVDAVTEAPAGQLVDDISNFLADLTNDNSANFPGAGEHAGHGAHMHHAEHMGHMGHMGHEHMMMGPGHDMHMKPQAMMDHGSMGGHHMMKMWFHGGWNEVILFDFWRIQSFSGLLFSCLLIFVMSALYEGIKWFRVYLQIATDKADSQKRCGHRVESHKGLLENGRPDGAAGSSATTSPERMPPRVCFCESDSPCAFRHVVQGLLYALQLTLAYWMMLIAMTYNSYLTAAVILGAAFGHWLFAVLRCFNPQADHLDSLATDACH